MPEGKLKSSKDSKLAGKIREAIGVGPDEEVDIVTPQFTRKPGDPVPASAPGSPDDWAALRNMTQVALKEMGLGNWDGRLMLFPGEWYNHIPAGFIVEDIFGEMETFKPGISDDDIRCGCLPYGIPAIDGEAIPDEDEHH